MKKAQPQLDETRIVKRFLFFPQALPWFDGENARMVKRWWEWAEVKQRFSRHRHKYREYFWWEDVAWADMVWVTVRELEAETDWGGLK